MMSPADRDSVNAGGFPMGEAINTVGDVRTAPLGNERGRRDDSPDGRAGHPARGGDRERDHGPEEVRDPPREPHGLPREGRAERMPRRGVGWEGRRLPRRGHPGLGLRRGPGDRMDPDRRDRPGIPGPWGGEGARRGLDAVLRDPRGHDGPHDSGVGLRGPYRVLPHPRLRAERVHRTGEAPGMTLAGGPTAAGGVESLPSLRFRTAFRNYEPVVRAATLVASVVVPAVCIGLFLWLLP